MNIEEQIRTCFLLWPRTNGDMPAFSYDGTHWFCVLGKQEFECGDTPLHALYNTAVEHKRWVNNDWGHKRASEFNGLINHLKNCLKIYVASNP